MSWTATDRYIGLASVICAVSFFSAGCTSSVAFKPSPAPDHIEILADKFSNANSDNVVIVAHRGCWSNAPENSIAAIEACVNLGVEVVELDVRATSDGVLVLMHDDRIDRTTTGTGLVADLSFAELSETRLLNRKGENPEEVSSEAPPTFEEAMLAAKGRILVNLDAKSDVYDAAFDILTKTDTQDHIIMKKRVRPGDPNLSDQAPFSSVISMPVIFQSDDPELSAVAGQSGGNTSAIEMIFDSISYAEMAAEYARKNGKPAWVNSLGAWTSAGLYDPQALEDPDSVWGLFIDIGYSIIQTDEPEALKAYLESR